MIFPKTSTLPCYKQKGNGEQFTLYTAVAVFESIYSHLKNKNGYIFYLLPEVCRQVIVPLSSWLKMQLLDFIIFSSWFNPLVPSVSSLLIQKFHSFSRGFRVSLLTLDDSLNFSIWVNFTCFMKLWTCFKKIARWSHFQITDIFPMII